MLKPQSLSSSRPMPASSHRIAALTKPPTLFFTAEHDVIWWLVSWGQFSWLCPLPSSCAPSASSLEHQSQKWKMSWCCSLVTKTVLSALFSSEIENIAPYKLQWTKLTQSLLKTVQWCNLWLAWLSLLSLKNYFMVYSNSL